MHYGQSHSLGTFRNFAQLVSQDFYSASTIIDLMNLVCQDFYSEGTTIRQVRVPTIMKQ